MERICGLSSSNFFEAKKTAQELLEGFRCVHGQSQLLEVGSRLHLGVTQSKSVYEHPELGLTIVVEGEIRETQKLTTVLQGEYLIPASSKALCVLGFHVLGPKFLEYIDGDFVLAIANKDTGELFLARDRVGKKNVYWTQVHNTFFFASELKALLAVHSIPKNFAPDGISAYLVFGHMPQDFTPIVGINKLLPAHHLTIEADHSIAIDKYWSLSTLMQQESLVSLEEVQEEVLRILRKNLDPFAKAYCALSRSASGVSIAHELSDVHGYCYGVEGKNEEDFLSAMRQSQYLGIDWHEFKLDVNHWNQGFVQAVWEMDEPIADPMICAVYHAALGMDGVEECYSGIGMDELFLNNQRYCLFQGECVMFKEVPKRFYRWLFPQSQCVEKYPESNYLQYLEFICQYHTGALEKLSPKLAHAFDLKFFLRKFYRLPSLAHFMQGALYLDVKMMIPDQMLRPLERFLSRKGISLRFPYLCQEMMEFLVSVRDPRTGSLYSGPHMLTSVWDGRVPREEMKMLRYVSSSLLRPYCHVRELQEFVKILKGGFLVNTGMISESYLDGLVLSDRVLLGSSYMVYKLLVLEVWFKCFMNRYTSMPPPEISLDEFLRV